MVDFSFKISLVFIRLDWFQMPYFHSWQIFAKEILTHLQEFSRIGVSRCKSIDPTLLILRTWNIHRVP